jgi:hypothetical protein
VRTQRGPANLILTGFCTRAGSPRIPSTTWANHAPLETVANRSVPMACGPGTPARGGSGAPRGGPCRSKVDPRLLPPTSEPRLGNRLGNRLGRGSLGGVWARDIPLYRRAVPGQRHGDSPASCWFKPCARRWPSEASRQDQRQPRPADPLLAKSDRAGSPPGQTTNRAGHGGREIVRGCPLATARVRCAWHGSGTAGEDDGSGPRSVGMRPAAG